MTLSHKKIILATLFTIFLVFVSGIVIDESFAETPELFTNVSEFSQQSSLPLHVESSAILASETVTVDLSILDNEIINMTLFDKTYIFTHDRTDNRGIGDFTWFGSNNEGNAIITVQGGKIVAAINTPDGNFVVDANEDNYNHQVKSIALGKLVESPHTFIQQDVKLSDTDDSYYLANIAQVILTHDRFRPSNLDELDTVYVDVYVGYTKAVKDKYTSTVVDRKIQNEIDNANHANTASRIPVEFVLVDKDEYRYTEKSTSIIDKDNLIAHTDSILKNLRNDANDKNADILVLITSPSNSINDYGCGVAGGPIAKHPHDSVAVVAYECLDGITLTHEMGHLFGAGHNRDFQEFGNDNSPFGQFRSDGYGYYDTNVNMRTVMSYDCDDTEFDAPDEGVNVTCRSQEVWSDPDVNFPSTATPAGNDANYNARAIFGAGPYIASMQGEVQKYDSTPPTGFFEWLGDQLSKIFTQGTVISITANFDEYIASGHPPKVTISDTNNHSTDYIMDRVSNTQYSKEHTLTNEEGTVSFAFSEAQDLYGNVIVPTPTGGGSIMVEILDVIPPRIDTINRQDPATQVTTNSILTFRVTFDEDVTGVDYTDFATNGTATSFVTGLTPNSALQYDVIVTVTTSGTVSLGLISTGYGIEDIAFNSLLNSTSITTPQTFIVALPDIMPPTFSVTTVFPVFGNTAKVGDNIIVTLTAGSFETGLESSGTQIVNGVNSTFAELNSGNYTITYTVSEGDISILDSAEIPVNITLKDSAGNVGTTITAIPYNIAPGIDANSPVFSSAVIDSTTQISITTNQIIYDNSAEYGDFTLYGVSGGLIDSINSISDTIITLNIANATISDFDTVTIDYTRTIGSINDVHGNVLQDFTNQSVTNNLDTTNPTSTITTISPTSSDILFGTTSDDSSGVYKVEISTDDGVTFSDATGTTSWSFDISGLSDSTYSIIIRTSDNAGNTDTTTLLSLTISRYDSTVSAVTLLNPINGSSVPVIPILDWYTINDTDLPKYPYIIVIANDDTFNDVIVSTTIRGSPYYISAQDGVVDGNTYYWKVITRDIINNTATSEIGSFTYDVTAPVGSIVIDGISSTDDTITIDWQANSYNENNIKKVLFYVGDSDLNLIIPSNLEYTVKGIRGLQETFGSTTITTINGNSLLPGTEYFVQLFLDIRHTPNDNVYSGMIPITTTS